MGTIKVLASNIYDYEPINDSNTITSTDVSLTVVTALEGDILDKEYSQLQKFYTRNVNDDGTVSWSLPDKEERDKSIYPWEPKTIQSIGGIQVANGYYILDVAKTDKDWFLQLDKEKNILPDVEKMYPEYKENWGISKWYRTEDADKEYETQSRRVYSEKGLYISSTDDILKLKWERPPEVSSVGGKYNFVINALRIVALSIEGAIMAYERTQRHLLDRQYSIIGTYYETSQKEYKYALYTDNIQKFTLPSNELVQESNTKSSILNFNETFASSVLDRYENGKEVYTLKCSVADYYDTEGNLKISIGDDDYLPMMFQKYDKVQPYIFTSEGEVPLGKDKNGNPKVFEVIGTEFSYSGVPWQELTIQECKPEK